VSCVIGLRDDEGGIWIGADSASIQGWDMVLRKDAKVFRRLYGGEQQEPMVIGFTGSYRMGQILQYEMTLEDLDLYTDAAAMDYMVQSFIPAAREALRKGGALAYENGEERCHEFLVGFRGHLYYIGRDFQVGEPQDPFIAVGCGAQAAMGAMVVLKYTEAAPRTKIVAALGAAEHLNIGVRKPFTVLGTGGEE